MITYFSWWYSQELINLWRAVVILSRKVWWSFSVTILLKTLFDPWKRDVLAVENASLDVRFNIFLQNLVSRAVGFVVRLFTIFAGIVFTLITFIFLIIIFIGYLLMPIIIIFLFVNGIRIIING